MSAMPQGTGHGGAPLATPAAPAAPSSAAPGGAGAVPAPEGGAAAPAATPAQPIAKQFSVLARKEQQLQREREAARADREAAAAERAQLAKERAEIDAHKARRAQYKSNPKLLLEDGGLTLRELNEFTLNDDNPTAEQLARQAIEGQKSLEQRLEDERKAAAESQRQQLLAHEQAAEQAFRGEVHDFITQGGEAYELTAFFNQQDAVFEAIKDHYEKTGKLLELKEAAEVVEAYIEEQVAALTATKKFRAKHGQPAPALKPGTPSKLDPQPDLGQVSAQRRTLSSDLTSSTPTLAPSPRVEEDRIKRALAALDRKP